VITLTVKPSGGDYTSLTAALNSLGVLTDDVTIVCDAFVDTTATKALVDHTPGAYTVLVTVAEGAGHNGTYDDSGASYLLDYTGSAGAFVVSTAGVTIKGIQINVTSSSNIYGMNAVTGAGVVMEDTIICGLGSTGTLAYGVRGRFDSVITMINCFIFGFKNGGTSSGLAIDGTGTFTMLNCTLRDCSYGFLVISQGTVYSYNCLMQNSVIESFEDGTYVGSHNMTDDSSAADEGIGLGGVLVDFIGTQSAITKAGQGCQGTGVGLDSVGITTDIAGNPRPTSDFKWDIGAYQNALRGSGYNPAAGGVGYNSLYPTQAGYNSILGGGYSSKTI